MAPKRSAPTNGSRSPAKRVKTIGAPSIADDTSRLIAAHHQAEHAGQGQGYLSRRPDPFQGRVPSLSDYSLRVSAEVLYATLKLPPKPVGGSVSLVGWDKERRQDDEGRIQMGALREFVRGLPSSLANRLLSLTLQLSSQADEPISVLALSTLFLQPNTTALSFSGTSLPVVLLSAIPSCTALTSLDLANTSTLTDAAMAKVLLSLSRLEKLNLRGCTKVGNASVIALSKATEDRLREVNLSMCAVSVKGLVSLLARCSRLEVLKLANMTALNEKNVAKLVDDATDGALGYRHIPLSNLRTLKLRSTELSDSSLGRLLALCSLSLTHLDISYTLVKSLDMVSSALHTAPEWRLEKLVASGLPLSPASLRTFFEPLSQRPLVERSRFKTLKLGAIPANSSRAPGLTDGVLEKILPYLEELEGLEHVSLFQNWELGKRAEPMTRFMRVLGRRCKTLDLTVPLESHHLEGLYGFPDPEEDDGAPLPPPELPRLQSLVLDNSRITDIAAGPISQCVGLRALHLAETRISTRGLSLIMQSCPRLATLNLTSCRGIPVAQRRTFFEAWERGEVVVDPLESGRSR